MEILKLDVGLMVWTLVTFAGLLFLLGRYAFRPLKRVLTERETRIRETLAKAEKVREEARQLLARNEQQMDEARLEARRIISEGHRIVARMKRETQESAKHEADLIVEQARTEITQEARRAMEDLKDTVANLSLRIARQLIKEEIDDRRHKELVTEFVDRLKEHHGRGRT